MSAETPDKARLTGVAQVLLVRDVFKSASYWEKQVGFSEISLHGEPKSFCIARRDGLSIMLAQVTEQVALTPHWKNREMTWNVYFWVNDAARLYAELKERGARIDYEPYKAPHGCLEFGIQDLEDNDIAFGQVIR